MKAKTRYGYMSYMEAVDFLSEELAWLDRIEEENRRIEDAEDRKRHQVKYVDTAAGGINRFVDEVSELFTVPAEQIMRDARICTLDWMAA